VGVNVCVGVDVIVGSNIAVDVVVGEGAVDGVALVFFKD